MANQEALIAEYSALREEISRVLQNQMQFIGAALAVASAFIVYGFQAHSSLAFFAANIMLLAEMYIGANSTRHVALVATYLYAIVEPKVEGLQWETMLAVNRKRENRISSRLSYLRLSYPRAISIYALITIGCVFFAWLFLRDYRIFHVLLYSCISVILGVTFILVSVYALHVSSDKYRSDYINLWKKIEEELYSKVATIYTNS